MSIDRRKADHIRINLEEDVSFPTLTTGFEHYRFVHQALPELNLADVETTTDLFGKRLSAPILVSSMTGGTAEAHAINRNLAQAAQRVGLAMGLGSQRAGLERPETVETFRVRAVAPDILLFANLGAVQLNYGYTVDHCRRAVEMVEADALFLHLNPLQEAVQAEGDVNWGGLCAKIEAVCRALPVPVIAKEVGWGISAQTARRLIEAGVRAIDVAGAGGTSWSQVEMHRAPTERLRRLAAAFGDWGIPTAETLQTVCAIRTAMGCADLPVFASGGIRTGLEAAKAVALGAELAGLASPFLRRAAESAEAVVEEMELLIAELRIAMFGTGSPNILALRAPGVLVARGVSNLEYKTFERSNTHPSLTTGEKIVPDGELSSFIGHWLPQIEAEMRAVLAAGDPPVAAHYGMLRYHLGWADEQLRPLAAPSGKRLRPILCLLACAETGGDPAQALPVAAAIELLHNFSLIHDDVEDGDELRRHRPTVWKLWGIPQAINAGDGMFALAYAALQRLSGRAVPATKVLAVLDRFTQTCLALTEGQYLDISFESRACVTVDEYMRMIQGKTAALIGAATAIGALLGHATPTQVNDLSQFGHATGLAFQIQDDILGIWGDPAVSGKAAGNDILRRKKSLPMLHVQDDAVVGPAVQHILAAPPRAVDQIGEVMKFMEQAGTAAFAAAAVQEQHQLGRAALDRALGPRAAGSPLLALADSLLQRAA